MIPVLEVTVLSQNCFPYVQIGLSITLYEYMRILLLMECFDLCPSSKFISVNLILRESNYNNPSLFGYSVLQL
jgi:hypothetical protein